MSLYLFRFVRLCWQGSRLRLAAMAEGGWWWWVLLAIGVGLSGCRSRWVPLSDVSVSRTHITSRDTLIRVPSIRYQHVFDTLPLHVPVFAEDSSQQVVLQLTRRPEGLEAVVRVIERQVLVPRTHIARTDTVRIERLAGQVATPQRRWWRGLLPGALLGALLVLGLRFLLR